MKTLILHPTETCQWYALVNEAQEISSIILDENTESYLVFLLMRFSKGTEWAESILALDFLESLQAGRHRQVDLLQTIGDKSLLFCGLFPGVAKRRQLSLNYFSDMGQNAYRTVSELTSQQSKQLFQQLSEEFINLQKILAAMRTEYWHVKQNPTMLSVLNLKLQ